MSVPKVPFTRRKIRNWHAYLHSPENDLDVKFGRTDRTVPIEQLDEPDYGRREVTSAAPDGVDIAFGKSTGEEDKKYCQQYTFTTLYFFLGIVSILLFMVDIVYDIYIAATYFIKDQAIFGAVTIVFTAGPSLVMCVLGLHWYKIDYDLEQKEIQELRKTQDKHWVPSHETPKAKWVIRVIFTVLQLGPLFRTAEYLYYGWKSTRPDQVLSKAEKIRYHNWMLYEDLDASLLRLFEGFLEAAPQLVFQLYAWAMLRPTEDVVLLSFRIVGLFLAWGSLSLSLTSYHKSLRYSRNEKKNLSLKSTPFYLMWRACEIGGRVLCFALFAITYQAWILLPILLHWFIVTLWISHQRSERTRFYEKKWQERLFNMVCGYVMIFCFLNLQEGHTRFRYIVYYVLFYVENFCMIGVWFRLLPTKGSWYDVYGLVLVLVLFVLHIILQILYYKCCHPQDIKTLLPCNKNLIYESVCHQLKTEEKLETVKMAPDVVDLKRSDSNNSHDSDITRATPLLSQINKADRDTVDISQGKSIDEDKPSSPIDLNSDGITVIA